MFGMSSKFNAVPTSSNTLDHTSRVGELQATKEYQRHSRTLLPHEMAVVQAV
jgi:hypothetical protein